MLQKITFAKTIFALLIVLSVLFALSLQFSYIVETAKDNNITRLQAAGRFFLFFTVLTHLLLALSLLAITLIPSSSFGKFFSTASSSASIAVYIFFVGLIYNLLLRDLWKPQGWQLVANELLHLVIPVLYVLFWFLYSAKSSLQWKDSIIWLIYPFAYLCYMLIFGAAEEFYPYPFLNANDLGYSKIFLNAGGLLVVLVLLGLSFIAIGRLQKHNNRSPDNKQPNY